MPPTRGGSAATPTSWGAKTVKAEDGIRAKHWKEVAPGCDNQEEVAAARLKLMEEITGEEASRKLEVRGLVFPQ